MTNFFDGLKRIWFEDQTRPSEWRLELSRKNHPSPRQVAQLALRHHQACRQMH